MLLTVIDYIFWFTILLLIVGLIRPSLFSYLIPGITREKIGGIFGIVALVLFIAAMIIGSSSHKIDNTTSLTPTQEAGSDIDQFPALKDFFSGNNNENQPKLRNFEYFPGTGALNLDLNLDQTMSDPIKSIELQMSDAYMNVFNQKDTPEVTTMTVTGWLPEQDSYGNSKYVEVVGTRLSKDDVDKVNWNTDKPTLELQILPGLWKTFFAAPSLNWPTNQ